MSEHCHLRDPTPKEKPVSLYPRSEWMDCPFCGGRHRNQATFNTCKFLNESLGMLNDSLVNIPNFKEEGSTESCPSYETSLSPEIVWSYMVPRIIKRDHGCCTDCGISYFEMKAMQDAALQYRKEWSDGAAHRAMLRDVRAITYLIDMPNFEVHHILPRVRGGTHHPHNLRLLCSVCHRKYTNELLEELASERRSVKEEERIRKITEHHRPLESFVDECLIIDNQPDKNGIAPD